MAEWCDAKETLHRFAQSIGKIRLAAGVQRDHWCCVPLHLTGRGTTTRPMGQVDGNPTFAIDFVAHRLVISVLDGRQVSFPLVGRSVASFYRAVVDSPDVLGVRVRLAAPQTLRPPRFHPAVRRALGL